MADDVPQHTTTLVVDAGVSWAEEWPITDLDGKPLDVTGYTVHAQVRPFARSPKLRYDFAAAGNASAEGNWVKLAIPAADSAGWAWNRAVYDVHLLDPGGDVTLVARGSMFVRHAVTVD